jgi:hypothetical protein
MSHRLLPLLVAALALCVFAAAPLLAADKGDSKSHEGKFVRAEGNKLVMVDKDGKNEHTHTLSADAVITCNGKKCQVTDLKKGMFLKVTTRDKARWPYGSMPRRTRAAIDAGAHQGSGASDLSFRAGS